MGLTGIWQLGSSAMSKDIRCLFGRHKYACGDMVLKHIAEDERTVKYVVKMRCVKCGKIREDLLEIPKQWKGVQ